MKRHAWSVVENQNLQQPIWPRVVYLAEIVGGWWQGLQRHCDACGGRLMIEPPALLPGEVCCLLCRRVVAEVRERRYVPPPLPTEPIKRGRPTGSKLIQDADRRACADCGVRVAKLTSPRCYACGHARGRVSRG